MIFIKIKIKSGNLLSYQSLLSLICHHDLIPGGVQAVGEDTSVDTEMVRGLVRRFEGALVEGAIGEWE